MRRSALLLLVVPATLLSGGSVAWAVDNAGAGCQPSGDGRLDHVADCVRMGRHVRVESSVSRGTATLRGEGVTPAADNASDRVRVPAILGGALWSGVIAR